MRSLAATLLLAVLLAGCAQLVRDQATAQVKDGNYEAAIQVLQEGLARYPENAMLRSGLITAKAEAIARWTAEAAQHRNAGRWDEAEKSLRRALQLEPQNDRLLAQLDDLAAERRMQQRLDAAARLAGEGRKTHAVEALDAALRESPRHLGAITLKRKLEADLRADGTGPGRVRLAESRPITLDFRGAPLATVLEAVTRGSGINFILDRDVKQDGRVTVFLRSTAVEDAIDLIAGSNQLARRIVDPRTVLIFPNTPDKLREHQEQVVRVFHLANVDAKATGQLLRSMLRLKEVFVDDRSNMVAIREAPEVVAMAERLVALHDTGDAEVMLEIEILEVRTNRLTELGVVVPNAVTLSPLAPGGGVLTIEGLRDLNSSRIGVSIGNVTLNLRREVGDFNILANPRIRARNREKARVLIGDRFPVVSTTTSATTAMISESITYLDVGLKLDVEPVVSPDDDVTIKLGLEVSAIAGTVRTAGGSLAYQVGTRNANTTLRLRDGETQVLAGLISNDDRMSATRIPGLGDLPIAGRLFSSQKDEYQRTELILAITPRVLRSAARPDISQAELWIGTDNAPRLKNPPSTAALLSAAAPGPAAFQMSATASVPADDKAVDTADSARLTWQGPVQVKVGEVFAAPLQLVSGTLLRGAMVELEYPANLLEIVEVSEGAFFKQGGGQTSFTQNVAAAEGRITLGVLRSDLTGASGAAPLAELRMRAKAAGGIELKVASLRPVGLGGEAPSARLSAFHLSSQ